MVASVPIKPLPLLILHLDQGEKYYAGKTIDFKGLPFVARVISFGTVERTLPYPTGLIAVPDAVVDVADTDGQLRAWFDERTPLKRIGELSFEFEANADTGNIDHPIPDPENQDTQPEYTYRPFFTGEVTLVETKPGMVTIHLRDITASWLSRTIPNLGIRDNFPNMPDDVESIFIPIIFGRVYSKSGTGLEPQGVIDCKLIDTSLFRYAVARHQCYSINTVYRKKPHDARFFIVSVSEYTVNVAAKVINGINWNITYIDFDTQQPDGTEIHADVSGVNYRWDFDSESQVNGVEVRDFVDSIVNLTFLVLQDEVEIQRFDGDSFLDTRTRTQARGYLCDGAITEQISNGLALSRLAGDAVIDFYQTNRGIISLHLYDAALDADSVIPLDDDDILKKSLEPGLPPPDKLFNHIRYRYYRQNAGLSEFRKSSNTGQWGEEYTVDNLADQEEMAAIGSNPKLETQIELYFIRDDATAKKVIKDRLAYFTLRSYTTDLSLSGPVAVDYISLSQPLMVTEIWGIGPAHSSPSAGWVDKVCKVYGITFDLSTLEAKLSAVVPVQIDDGDLDWSIDDSHAAHAAQVRQPHLTTTINGSVDPEDPTRLYPNADQTLDFEDSLTEVVTAGISFPSADPIITNFSSGPSASTRPPLETTPSLDTAWQGIHWEEDVTTRPRSVKGYVPIPFFGRTTRNYIGTLDPDQKPTGLTEDDAGQVTFYAVDFDRYFLWIGSGSYHSLTSSTGWIGVLYDMGMIGMFMLAPTNPGWALCDGSTVDATTIEGTIAPVTLDNLVSGSDRFPRLTSTYVPIADSSCNAIAPSISGGSISGTTGSAGGHDHGGVTGSEAGHTHNFDHTHGPFSVDDLIGDHLFTSGNESVPHSHTASFTGSGSTSTSSNGAHTHSGSTGSEAGHTHNFDHGHDIGHSHGGGNTGVNGAHDHSGYTDGGSNDGIHTHAISPDGAYNPNITVAFIYSIVNCINAISGGNTVISASGSPAPSSSWDNLADHNHGGYTNNGTEDGEHKHIIDPDGDHTHTISSFIGTVAFTGNTGAGSSHLHSISSDGAHTHTFLSSGTISVDNSTTSHSHIINIDPLAHLTSFVFTGNTGTGSSHSHSISSVAAHTHSFSGSLTGATAGTNGRPKSVGVMPYFRL